MRNQPGCPAVLPVPAALELVTDESLLLPALLLMLLPALLMLLPAVAAAQAWCAWEETAAAPWYRGAAKGAVLRAVACARLRAHIGRDYRN